MTAAGSTSDTKRTYIPSDARIREAFKVSPDLAHRLMLAAERCSRPSERP